MGGVRDTERFKGLWCVWPERIVLVLVPMVLMVVGTEEEE